MEKGVLMNKNKEIELKLQVMDETVWSALGAYIKNLPGVKKSEKINLLANYFDTADERLSKARLSYRVRRENDVWIATIKGDGSSLGGLHSRMEINVLVHSPKPDLSVFQAYDIHKKILQVLDGVGLEQIVQTDFEREAVLFEQNETWIEIALDQGSIIAADKKIPILEVELELKKGKAAELLSLGSQLTGQFPLRIESKSKLLRGLLLTGRAKETPVYFSDNSNPLYYVYGLLDLISQEWAEEKQVDSRQHLKTLDRLFSYRHKITGVEIELQEIYNKLNETGKYDRQKYMFSLLQIWKNMIL
jgi:inorganic triphosphatase YgiF